jgi:hypothetical protein
LSLKGNIVLMCAEEDPLRCHRFLMISSALVERGVIPLHIPRGGALETQRDSENPLFDLHGFADVTSTSPFTSGRDAALADALRFQHDGTRIDPPRRPDFAL